MATHPNIMLGSLSIGCWTARKIDRKSASKTEQEAGAKAGTSSASKHLMANVTSFERVTKHASATRAWWGTVTLPWFDGRGAPRAVNAKGVWDLKQLLGEKERQYLELVDEFIREYPSLRTQRQFDMGDLFDPREFPETRDLKRRFYFTTSWTSLPNSEDIRLADGLDKHEVDVLVKQAVENERSRVEQAMNHAATRLHDVVKALHEKMAIPIGETGSKFHNTKLENISELVEIIPILNVTNDPKLNKLAQQAKKLAMKSPDELREDAVKRAATADEAKKLAEQIAGLFDVTVTEDD